MDKSADAFRTISEAASELGLPQHVLRFWETRFPQIKPMKRAGGRRYYRPQDLQLLHGIKHLLYAEGFTIKGVQKILKEQGARVVAAGTVATQDAHALSPDEVSDSPLAQSLIESDADLTDDEPALPGDDAAHADGESAPVFESGDASQTFSPSEIAKLEEILIELAECVRILAAARRR
jgi:DNA-binding transcriptional MerR regulator